MLFDYVALYDVQLGHTLGVFQGDAGVMSHMPAAEAFFFAVIEKQIVQETAPCGGTGVKPKTAAHKETVIGHVQTMLKARTVFMMRNIPKPYKIRRKYQVADTGEVFERQLRIRFRQEKT